MQLKQEPKEICTALGRTRIAQAITKQGDETMTTENKTQKAILSLSNKENIIKAGSVWTFSLTG